MLLRQGTRGNLLPLVLERAVEALAAGAGAPFGPGLLGRTYAASFLVSADVTHAAHPNFLGNYLPSTCRYSSQQDKLHVATMPRQAN